MSAAARRSWSAVLREPLWTVAVAVGILGGLALRVWILTSPLGALDADEAIVGLMARDDLDGIFTVFYWGQAYGGSQEALLTAVPFALFGQSVIALKLVPVALYAVAALLVWRVGRRTVGEPAASIGGALAWVWPGFHVWWSTKERGFYGIALVSTLLVVLFALRLRERDSRLDATVLGLALGQAWWATPLALVVVIPTLVWLVCVRKTAVRLAGVAGAGFLVGALPWLVHNVRNGFTFLDVQAFVTGETSFWSRLADLFGTVVPTWLGLRIPFSPSWLLGRPLGLAAVAILLIGFVYLAVRRPPGLGLLLLIAIPFPFVYAASTFGYLKEPRYLTLLAPVAALLLARALARRPVYAVAGLAVAAAMSTVALVKMERWGLYRDRAPDIVVPEDLSPAVALLDRHGVRRLRANYFLAYPIAFASNGRVIVSTTYTQRNARWERLVAMTAKPPWLFMRGSRTEVEARPVLERDGYRRVESGDYVLYVPRNA